MTPPRPARLGAALAALLGAGAIGGCKVDEGPRPAPARAADRAAPGSGSDTAWAGAARPSAPPADADAREPLTPARAAALAPDVARELPGATALAPPQPHADGQVRQAWCVPGGDAEAAARGLARALGRAGWEDVTHRGTAARAGASGVQDGLRVSIAVGGRDAACEGLVASALYHDGRVTVPALDPGERVH